ncbi:hypothetical protein HBI56_183640 [Parastagonospora nodorum]|nr:hypothetical protein HBH56_192110 [Parastagonospora nodorum]KAH3937807.1 hypothetical protein HBH54_009870 [Parastagonospora nodorum]KAH3940718.1 hypothetical protein HBH53_212460 [Parastagonospora nodorum]KAH3966441.1 hypothetical protein HBH52_198820 [Parastagonospora nodorum]KAH3994250.1 hypothetical protein HBI10_189670 [Parastagonospora nodorum]
MQNNNMAAQMAAMNANGGPVDGTPIMGNMPHPKRPSTDPREQLNTYIYDYLLRNDHYQAARAMLESGLKMATGPPQKYSPKNRVNGDSMMEPEPACEMPAPQLPQNQMAENSFLLDWWVQFWDIYQATKNRGNGPTKGSQYVSYTRNLAQVQNEQRNQRMMMNNNMNAQYQNMMRNGMVNGAPNDLKRAAALNNRPNGNAMPNMGQMKNPAMMAAQMQRDGSNMDMNGQRPQSPGPNENAPSPNKRPRMEGGMNNGMPNAQFGDFAQPGQNAQQKNIEGMNSGAHGSPMAQQGLEGQHDIFQGNGPRPGAIPANAPGAPQGNHALQDYQMQLMLLEQQNKKRLLMARQEQDNVSGPQHQGGVGAQGFPAAMSPQGNRPGPSPNPQDQMKRGTPKLGQMPGSPLPEGAMQPQRGSPAPNMNFDPSLAPPGMPPQFYPQMAHQQSPMMRPPSSHPGAAFNGQQMTPQQMEAVRNGQMQQQPNGAWRGAPQQQGMMPGQQPMGGPMGNNPQQRQMPPPPAPANDQPRPEPSPSQSNQAPPTPSSANKPNPKKKGTKDNVKPAGKKGANAGATPSATTGEEPPTPTTSTPVAPITPHSKQSFNPQNGQPQQVQQQPVQQQSMDPPFGNIDGGDSAFSLGDFGLDDGAALENFDFDSFLQNPNDGDFGMTSEFDFNHVTEEVGGGL